jgi:hypothetical protein
MAAHKKISLDVTLNANPNLGNPEKRMITA